MKMFLYLIKVTLVLIFFKTLQLFFSSSFLYLDLKVIRLINLILLLLWAVVLWINKKLVKLFINKITINSHFLLITGIISFFTLGFLFDFNFVNFFILNKKIVLFLFLISFLLAKINSNKKLILILILSFFLKNPYLSTNAVSQLHSDKYSSYIPAAEISFNKKDIFYFENNSYVNWFDNSDHNIQKKYVNFPFYNFYYYPFFLFKGLFATEVFVRLPVVLLGLIFLYTTYLSIKEIFNEEFSLLFLSIILFQPIINLVSFITIMDLPAFIFFNTSIYFYFRKKYKLAYLFSGFSILMKLSFLPIILSFYTVSFIFNKEKKLDIDNFLNFIFGATLPTICFLLTINYLPSINNNFIRIFSIAIFVLINILYLKINFKKIYQKKELFVILLFISPFLFKKLYELLSSLSKNFLPTIDILLYKNTYLNIITDFFNSANIGTLVFFFIVGFIYLLRNKSKILIAFLLSMISYFILAIKPIYFHVYYKLYIYYVYFIISSYGIYLLSKNIKNKFFKNLFLSTIIFLNSIYSISLFDSYLNRNPSADLGKLASIIKVDKNEKILRSDAKSRNLALYNPYFKIVNYSSLGPISLKRAKEEVKENGFCNLLKITNSKYLLTQGESDFSYFLYLYENYNYDRESLILDNNIDNVSLYSRYSKEINEIKNCFEFMGNESGYDIYQTK